MGIDTTEHVPHLYCTCPFLKFLIPDTPTFTQNASSQLGLTNRKWPTCLGQLEEQLEKRVGSIPITETLDTQTRLIFLPSLGDKKVINIGIDITMFLTFLIFSPDRRDVCLYINISAVTCCSMNNCH